MINRDGNKRPATGHDLWVYSMGLSSPSSDPSQNEIRVTFHKDLNRLELPMAHTCFGEMKIPYSLKEGDVELGIIKALEFGTVFTNL